MRNADLPPRYISVHAAGGALLFTALGAVWALIGALELGRAGMPWLNLALGAITGVLMILSVRAMQRAGEVPTGEMTRAQWAERGRRVDRARHVLTTEGIVITAASAALILLGHHAYIAPVTALVVGLHFVALAAIHRTSGEYVVGGLMILLAGATMLFVPRIPSQSEFPMNAVTGLGTAAILWGGAVARVWTEMRRLT